MILIWWMIIARFLTEVQIKSYLTISCVRNSMVLSSSRDKFTLLFLLISGRHLDEQQHSVSKQISLNLGKTFLRISCLTKLFVIWILARVFGYLPSFSFQILDFIYLTVLTDFYFDLFGKAWHWKPAIALCLSLPLPASFKPLRCLERYVNSAIVWWHNNIKFSLLKCILRFS